MAAAGKCGAISLRNSFITIGADDAAFQRKFARHRQSVEAGLAGQHQQFDEGAIPLGLFQYSVAHQLDLPGKFPCDKGRAIAQCAGLPSLRIAVNLSARHFRQPGLDAMVARVLEETCCRPDMLEPEITETVLMARQGTAAVTLQRLSDMGVQLPIDDFGTGYSSLSYLKRFPINALKIDRSFVSDISADADDGAIAGTVIALVHSMGLTVVAEGVETSQQRDLLRQLKCDKAQGFYFSEPMTAAALQNTFYYGEAQA